MSLFKSEVVSIFSSRMIRFSSVGIADLGLGSLLREGYLVTEEKALVLELLVWVFLPPPSPGTDFLSDLGHINSSTEVSGNSIAFYVSL